MNKQLSRKVLIASLTGSSIEWFDYFLYGTVASLVFNELFFPSFDPLIGLLLAYASFSLTFFIRPLGGVIFAHIGDKIGRKKTLVLTLSLMGGATVLIGLLPTYAQVGVWAPILLITLRLIQGLGLGGEWGGALLLAVEYAPEEKKGFFGSIPQMGVPIGLLLGTFALTLMSLLPEAAFMTWGWRVPFILSSVLVFVGLWIRKGIDETPAFKEAKKSGELSKMPIAETFKYHWREVLIAVGAKVVETAPFYIFATFVVSYATGTLGYNQINVLNAVTIGTLITAVMIPLMGKLSDRIGRKPVYIAGSIGMALYAYPYFLLLSIGETWAVILATVIALGIVWPPITAVLGTMFSEIFSTRVRYTGISLGYQIGAALAGGTAPLIATWLLSKFNNSWSPIAIFIIATAIISLIAVKFTSDSKTTSVSTQSREERNTI
ncbi:MHS family MFS transporter [Halobacillus shinanisalinarum]|uniref:MHS family MFS transporter n=1 Tax=Halobacillus shinanisalinarum TaxID=2932258 RepID=A0ABY4GVY2_9BACI|nr:MFS transporter [Halobacillus shinanisalinarum]UOQ92322.1 MHS family MFS transporter [Halobacillus shinanisalinarum]